MTKGEDLQKIHEEGQKYEAEERIDPADALARSIAYSREEKDAFEAGRESVRKQRSQNP